PLEERRTQAVYARRTVRLGADALQSSDAALGDVDAAAIARVRDEARPDPRDADELHDALLTAGFLAEDEAAATAPGLFDELAATRRATRARIPNPESQIPCVSAAAERLPELLAVHPDARLTPIVTPPASRATREWTRERAIVELVRGRLTMAGPTTAEA